MLQGNRRTAEISRDQQPSHGHQAKHTPKVLRIPAVEPLIVARATQKIMFGPGVRINTSRVARNKESVAVSTIFSFRRLCPSRYIHWKMTDWRNQLKRQNLPCLETPKQGCFWSSSRRGKGTFSTVHTAFQWRHSRHNNDGNADKTAVEASFSSARLSSFARQNTSRNLRQYAQESLGEDARDR